MNQLELLTRDVPRLFTERHAWLMYGLCKWLNVRSAVEVGAYHGFCSLHIAQAIKENGGGRLTVIDEFSLNNDAAVIHNNFAQAGLADILQIVSGDSREVAWPKSVDFAFIDGDHSFEGCLFDCNTAIEHGARVVCIHDTVSWWGSRRYVEEFRRITQSDWDIFEGVHDSGLAVLVKREPKGGLTYTEESHPSGKAF